MSEAQPWVLIRKGHPLTRFGSCEGGKRFFDTLRFNRGGGADAALFGPGGAAWYCRGVRWGSWERDDDRRKRQPETEPVDDGESEER
jgi:hypothetical protein